MPYKNPDQQKAYSRAHYKKYRSNYVESNKRRRAELKDFIKKLKQESPCKDCNESYPYYVMDFDHLSDKEALITKFVANNNRSGLENELKKCEIVCSNCHRERSNSRMLTSKKY